ncbi:MAG: restriction endonuclease subunit S [Duncaniella sp.]|nr:restriction endonuclease subunit S [Duncaniella sp.]
MIETKFKQTELGPIPENWEVMKLGTFTNVITGATPSTENSDYWGGNIPWMSSGELNNKIIYSVAGRITKEGYESASTHMLPINCVLIGLAGQGKTRGTAAINRVELCTNQSIGAILPSLNHSSDYLYLYFDSQYKLLRSVSSGEGGRGGLSKRLLLDFDTILPPREEQERIAEALNDIDTLIRELDTLIDKKSAVMQGSIQELLSAKRRLPGFSIPWKHIILGDTVNIYRGGSPRPIENFTTTNPNGLNWIKIGDVRPKDKYIVQTAEKIIPEGLSSTREVHVGDFILSNSMSFGRPYILKIDGCIHDGWLAITNYENTFDKDYLYYLLGSDSVYKQYLSLAAGSGVLNLNKKLVAAVELDIPDIEEQLAIAAILSDMDAEITELETKREKYAAIRQGMMQQLLTGKIRLI